ncbi:MAG: polyprenyl synthetase family protein [Endomicrobiales bacterium]|nr:polyprenyl synthetase family protein [Endomicrobiales bacterium]
MDKNTHKIIKHVRPCINGVIKQIKKIGNGIHPYSRKMLDSYLNNSGKMLRPLIALNLGYIYSKGKISRSEKEKIYRLAAVAEIIHGASLMHDDVIDNENKRRGKPSLNTVFGNRNAVLLGDIAFSKALEELNSFFGKGITGRFINAIQHMCTGQIQESDREFIKCRKKYLEMINNKTASLIRISAEIPVMVFKNRGDYLKISRQFGQNIGMLYQIMDDKRDKDCIVPLRENEIQSYMDRAKHALDAFNDSVYKRSLLLLIDIIYERAVE